MSPERARQVRTLFESAIELDPSEWTAFAERECGGDEELLDELLRLLAAYVKPRAELPTSPTFDEAPASAGPDPRIGKRVGSYQIIRQLGRGGMGVIYLAERADEAFSKKVAIKFVRTDLLGGELTRRFRQEREILASLDHPAIARLLDAGTANVDVPFLIMEYVDGERIDEYCAQRQLSVADRLRLFLQVCDAVSYAHRRLVIHRDLKPGNILVNAQGEVKLLDFGIAKLTGPDSQPSDLTHTGIRPFTPDYASPEQVQGKNLTTASDIWALGTILYELLTGFLPFEKQRGNLSDLERAICETDPLSPSKAVSGGESTAVDSRKLRRQLSGDLDNIVLKAMTKEPERRYGSVEQLSDDIKRHLAGEPVTAAPPSRAYRLRKFARKNRAWLAVGAAFALLLVAGVAAQTFELRRTVRERDRANRVTDFMTRMFKVTDPGEARGNDVRAREILDKASKDIETGLTNDPELRAQMMDVMGNVYQNLGLYAKAESLINGSVEIRRRTLGASNRDTLQSMNDLTSVLRSEGHNAEAEKLCRQTLDARLRLLGPEHRETLESTHRLATILNAEGRYPDAEKLNRQVLNTARRMFGPQDELTRVTNGDLAIDLAEEGKYPEAEEAFRATLEDARRALGPDHPATLGASANLANILSVESKFAEAEKVSVTTLQGARRVFGPEHPKTLICMDSLASILYGEKRNADAEKLYRETLELDRKVLGPEHRSTLITMGNLADVLMVEGQLPEAEQMTRAALDATRRILGPDHSVTLYAMERLGSLLKLEKRYREAEKTSLDTLEARRRILRPGHPMTAKSAYQLAEVLAIEGKRDEAFSQLQWAAGNGLTADLHKAMEDDGDLNSLHGDPRFARLLVTH